jgi:hypothetical protein
MQRSGQTHSIKGCRHLNTSPSCEESKECKEVDTQIPEEGRCYCVGKVKNVKKRTDKFQWRVVV